MNLYPLLMSPSFRHGEETPWGGDRLRALFGKDAPDSRTGESLEISALAGHESHVENGPCAGWPLSRVVSLWGEALTGRTDGQFPLLLKLLDARESLSVQVHPGDEYAWAHEGKPGKNEAWFVLSAEPGAKLVYGLESKGESLRTIVGEGRIEACLHWQEVHPGEVYYIPWGTIHALGPGIQCYEIQQSSDATYRFWDWGRTGRDGRPRELHIEKALAVTRESVPIHPCPERTEPCEGGRLIRYFEDPHFEMCRLVLSGAAPIGSGRMRFVMPLQDILLRWDQGSMMIKAHQSTILPAHLKGVCLEGKGDVLLSFPRDTVPFSCQ